MTNNSKIFKGTWSDLHQPFQLFQGFKNYSGIFLITNDNNSAYGNFEGGFADIEQAEMYNQQFLNGEFKIYVNIAGVSE